MIEIQEYGSVTVSPDPRDLPYLAQLVKGNPERAQAPLLEALTPTGAPNEYRLTAGAYVGRLGLPSGEAIDFLSRFNFDDVIRLIALSGRRPIRVDLLKARASAAYFRVDTIAMAFAGRVEKLARQGLAKGYRTRSFLSPPYPGTFDLQAHLRVHRGRPDRLATRARRLTRDVPVNRALLAGLQVLRRVPLIPEASRLIQVLGPVFAGVQFDRVTSSDIARIELGPLTYRYRSALALCELILRSQSLAPSGAGVDGTSVIFHMPKVWEAYVAEWVRRVWPDHSVEHGYDFPLSNRGPQLRAQADVVVWRDRKVVTLYDAKYKRAGPTPDRADIYQMVTYCERLGLDEATLVYPGQFEPRHVEVGERTIHMRGLALDMTDVEKDTEEFSSVVLNK